MKPQQFELVNLPHQSSWNISESGEGPSRPAQ
jgi:hypothetical protein